MEKRQGRRPHLGADRPRAHSHLERRHRLLRLLRHDRRPRGRSGPRRRRRRLAEAARDEAHDRPLLALRERRGRHLDRGLRHAAHADDGSLARVARQAGSWLRAREGEGPPRVPVRQGPAHSGACEEGPRRHRQAARGSPALDRHEQLRGRDPDRRRDLQRHLEGQVGLRARTRRRSQENGAGHEARDRSGSRLHRRGQRQAARHVHHAPQPQRGHPGSRRQALSLRVRQAALPREGQAPEDCAPDDARHPQGHPLQREALRRPLGGDVRRGPETRLGKGLRVGRALVDARGRRPGQRRNPGDGRQDLQEVPRLQARPHRHAGLVRARALVALAAPLAALVTACGGPKPPAHVTAFVNAAPKGSVPVVAFIDFECSFCRIAHARLEAAAAAKGATLSVDYRHVPLRSHPHATEAAAAQVCAAEQGRGTEAVHALLAVGPEGHDVEHLLQLARQLELHEERFTTCM
ncbi:MAG: hypothetical protein EOP08_09955, partial [Proteobacteria bacterium]